MDTEQPSKTFASVKPLVILAVLAIAWVLLRMYAQSGVEAYNKCYWQAVSNTDAAKNATIAAGYNSADATKASFDIYADQVYGCSRQKPPDWMILITGAKAKDSD
jgi:hypothetical protein